MRTTGEKHMAISYYEGAVASEAAYQDLQEGDNCPGLYGYIVDKVLGDEGLGLKGYIFYNINAHDAIVSFAGTENVVDGADDVFRLGWNQWKDARGDVKRHLNDYFENVINKLDPVGEVYFVGHSLGGALAQYAAYFMGEDSRTKDHG